MSVSTLISLRGFRFLVVMATTLCLAVAGLLARTETGARATVLPPPPAGPLARHASVRRPLPIRHVVVIYMENHTFDNLLGFWCDRHPGRCPDGGMPSLVVLSNGVRVAPHTARDVVPWVAHETPDQIAAINRGAMNGWQKIRGCQASKNYRCVSG